MSFERTYETIINNLNFTRQCKFFNNVFTWPVYWYCIQPSHHHHHQTSIFPRSSRVRRSSRNEAPPHIPEHCPFRVQTKRLHIILHTLIPSLPPSTRTSHPCHTTTFLQADTQSPSFLRSTCPNHLNLPRLTTSSTLCAPKRLYKSTLRFLSFSDTPHIHLIIIRSVLSRFCRFAFFIAQVSVPYVLSRPLRGKYLSPQPTPSGWETTPRGCFCQFHDGYKQIWKSDSYITNSYDLYITKCFLN